MKKYHDEYTDEDFMADWKLHDLCEMNLLDIEKTTIKKKFLDDGSYIFPEFEKLKIQSESREIHPRKSREATRKLKAMERQIMRHFIDDGCPLPHPEIECFMCYDENGKMLMTKDEYGTTCLDRSIETQKRPGVVSKYRTYFNGLLFFADGTVEECCLKYSK